MPPEKKEYGIQSACTFCPARVPVDFDPFHRCDEARFGLRSLSGGEATRPYNCPKMVRQQQRAEQEAIKTQLQSLLRR